MSEQPTPNSGTWVWYLGAIVIFALGGVTFALDGHALYSAAAWIGLLFCAGFLYVRTRR